MFRNKNEFTKIFNRLTGVNGKFTFSVKRKKLDNGKIVKNIYIFLEIPITRNHEKIRKVIQENGYDKKSLYKGKITLEPTNINGIEILKGILIIKPKEYKKIYRLLNQLFFVLTLSNRDQ